MFALAKAKLFAWPGIWPYAMGKQLAKKHSRRLSQGSLCLPALAYGPTLQGNNVQRNILGASTKARLLAWPGLWPCIVRKQPTKKHSKRLSQGQAWRLAWYMALHYGKTSYNETFQAPRPRLGLSPGLTYGLALWENNLQGNIQVAYVMNVGSLQITLLAILLLLCDVQISKGVYKGKKVHGVLIGTVCCVTLPSIPCGIMQTTLHPPFPSPKTLNK